MLGIIAERCRSVQSRYDMPMQSVGLLEAWGLWWQGKSVQGMSLWGVMPMLVVGRLGKVMAFIGTIVAVIDIIGPARIREWAARGKRRDVKGPVGRVIETLPAA